MTQHFGKINDTYTALRCCLHNLSREIIRSHITIHGPRLQSRRLFFSFYPASIQWLGVVVTDPASTLKMVLWVRHRPRVVKMKEMTASQPVIPQELASSDSEFGYTYHIGLISTRPIISNIYLPISYRTGRESSSLPCVPVPTDGCTWPRGRIPKIHVTGQSPGLTKHNTRKYRPKK